MNPAIPRHKIIFPLPIWKLCYSAITTIKPLSPPFPAAGMAASSEFLALAGSPAYSSFRLAELKDALNTALPGSSPKVIDVKSIHVHYVDARNPEALAQLKKADSEERKILDKLLTYDPPSEELRNDQETKNLAKALAGEKLADGKSRLVLYVVPRKGTITPWSSKASSISAVCGLVHSVSRIERGVLISLVFDAEYKDSRGPYPFADILHDRMTMVGYSHEMARDTR